MHKDFLAALECCLHPEPQSQHELGNVFLRFVSTCPARTLPSADPAQRPCRPVWEAGRGGLLLPGTVGSGWPLSTS